MPRHSYIYPEHMTKTDEGKALYGIWRRIRSNSCPEFEKYPDFFEWAFQNGYTLGLRLRRFDDSKAYCPDNCTFVPNYEGMKPFGPDERVRANEWNVVVNRIRKAYGLKPFKTYSDEEVRGVG